MRTVRIPFLLVRIKGKVLGFGLFLTGSKSLGSPNAELKAKPEILNFVEGNMASDTQQRTPHD